MKIEGFSKGMFLLSDTEKQRRQHIIDDIIEFFKSRLDGLNVFIGINVVGSFMTNKKVPNDIDVVLRLKKPADASMKEVNNVNYSLNKSIFKRLGLSSSNDLISSSDNAIEIDGIRLDIMIQYE
jgi:tRNA nucleotidyltransferase (CCA-adding enzyme)